MCFILFNAHTHVYDNTNLIIISPFWLNLFRTKIQTHVKDYTNLTIISHPLRLKLFRLNSNLCGITFCKKVQIKRKKMKFKCISFPCSCKLLTPPNLNWILRYSCVMFINLISTPQQEVFTPICGNIGIMQWIRFCCYCKTFI